MHKNDKHKDLPLTRVLWKRNSSGKLTKFNWKIYQGPEHKMSTSALCLHNQITANTWSDGPYCFYICIDVEVRVDYIRRCTKCETKRCPPKIKLHIFSGWDTSRGTTRTAPHGPTQAETYVCLIDVPLRTWMSFPKRIAKWLQHSSKHSNETVD